MTREKYESLPLSTLKEVAKTRGLRGISTMKKADLIEGGSKIRKSRNRRY